MKVVGKVLNTKASNAEICGMSAASFEELLTEFMQILISGVADIETKLVEVERRSASAYSPGREQAGHSNDHEQRLGSLETYVAEVATKFLVAEARGGESEKQAKAHSTDILLARNCLSGSMDVDTTQSDVHVLEGLTKLVETSRTGSRFESHEKILEEVGEHPSKAFEGLGHMRSREAQGFNESWRRIEQFQAQIGNGSVGDAIAGLQNQLGQVEAALLESTAKLVETEVRIVTWAANRFGEPSKKKCAAVSNASLPSEMQGHIEEEGIDQSPKISKRRVKSAHLGPSDVGTNGGNSLLHPKATQARNDALLCSEAVAETWAYTRVVERQTNAESIGQDLFKMEQRRCSLLSL